MKMKDIAVSVYSWSIAWNDLLLEVDPELEKNDEWNEISTYVLTNFLGFGSGLVVRMMVDGGIVADKQKIIKKLADSIAKAFVLLSDNISDEKEKKEVYKTTYSYIVERCKLLLESSDNFFVMMSLLLLDVLDRYFRGSDKYNRFSRDMISKVVFLQMNHLKKLVCHLFLKKTKKVKNLIHKRLFLYDPWKEMTLLANECNVSMDVVYVGGLINKLVIFDISGLSCDVWDFLQRYDFIYKLKLT